MGYKTASETNGLSSVDFCNFTDISTDISDISVKKSAKSNGQNCWTCGRLRFCINNSKSPTTTY